MQRISVKVKYIDEADNLCIEIFDDMAKAYARLESVRIAYGGESFPVSISVTPVFEETAQ